jgi:hypothetical protein
VSVLSRVIFRAKSTRKLRSLTTHNLFPPVSHGETKTHYFRLNEEPQRLVAEGQTRCCRMICLRNLNSGRSICSPCPSIPASSYVLTHSQNHHYLKLSFPSRSRHSLHREECLNSHDHEFGWRSLRQWHQDCSHESQHLSHNLRAKYSSLLLALPLLSLSSLVVQVSQLLGLEFVFLE